MARTLLRGRHGPLQLVAPLTFQVSRTVAQVARQVSHASQLSNLEVRVKRSQMFEEEKKRQVNLIPRLEKIEVQYEGPSDEAATLILNRHLSTPFHVAQHLSEMLTGRSVLALVNGEIWDMHRPLVDDCKVELLHFHMEDPFHANRAFWRSCSFLLGAAVHASFREDVPVHMHSFPAPNVASGSFVADVDLGLGHSWSPSREELMVFSAQMHRLAEQRLPFERLAVDAALALEMFAENPHKSGQIPNIAGGRGGKVTLYRVGDHVDISGGPMMADTSFLGRRCTVPVAHKIVQAGLQLYRFQGVALPKEVYLNHFAYSVLEKRAGRLNQGGLETTRPAQPV